MDRVSLGMHASTKGQTTLARQTFDALGVECVLWTASEEPANMTDLPNRRHFYRLPTPLMEETEENPNAYAERVGPMIRAWQAADPTCVFVVGNEPEQQADGDVPVPWELAEWIATAPRYHHTLKAMYGGVLLASAAVRVDSTEQLTAEYFDGVDFKTVHCYWQIDGNVETLNFGGSWRHVVDAGPALPVYVTEVNNSAGTNVDELLHWLRTLNGVAGCMFFIADALDTEWKRMHVAPEHAARVRTGYEVILSEANAAPVAPPSKTPYDENSSMLGGPSQYAGGWVRRISRSNPGEAGEIVADYQRGAAVSGISADIALGQASWETDNFTSPAWRTRRNAAGIGITADNVAGVNFGSIERGMMAHYALLCCYAMTRTPVAVEAWRVLEEFGYGGFHRGQRALKSLEGVWAVPGDGYAAGIASVANEAVALDTGGDIPEPSAPKRPDFIFPVDDTIIQGSDGDFSHGGKVPGFYAIDFGSAIGTPIRAIADATVSWVGFNGRSGQTGHTVVLNHEIDGEAWQSLYAHLSDYPAVGQTFKQGQYFAATGTPIWGHPEINGYGNGAHLHFELWRGIYPDAVRVRAEEYLQAGDTSQEGTGDMPKFGNRIDAGIAEHLWDSANYGRKKADHIEPHDANGNMTGFRSAWEKDLTGRGPYGMPWGLPVSKEYGFPDGRTCQDYTLGTATFTPDGTITFN